jgi:hypothetical protein
MLDRLARLVGVSPTVAALVLVLLVVQLATQGYALVDLARRDAVRGGNKWVWVLVIALGNLPGTIAYLAAGRPMMEADVAGAGSGANASGVDAARHAMEALYGPRDRR